MGWLIFFYLTWKIYFEIDLMDRVTSLNLDRRKQFYSYSYWIVNISEYLIWVFFLFVNCNQNIRFVHLYSLFQSEIKPRINRVKVLSNVAQNSTRSSSIGRLLYTMYMIYLKYQESRWHSSINIMSLSNTSMFWCPLYWCLLLLICSYIFFSLSFRPSYRSEHILDKFSFYDRQ